MDYSLAVHEYAENEQILPMQTSRPGQENATEAITERFSAGGGKIVTLWTGKEDRLQDFRERCHPIGTG